MNLLLDTGILGQLCHPANQTNRPVMDWVDAILDVDTDDRIFLPEVCDYEIRRELLRLCRKAPKYRASINRLDELCDLLEYLPFDTATMRKASEFWADVRAQGRTTAPDAALDGDVILAAQAYLVEARLSQRIENICRSSSPLGIDRKSSGSIVSSAFGEQWTTWHSIGRAISWSRILRDEIGTAVKK